MVRMKTKGERMEKECGKTMMMMTKDNGSEEYLSYLISASPINSQYLSTMSHVTLAPFSMR